MLTSRLEMSNWETLPSEAAARAQQPNLDSTTLVTPYVHWPLVLVFPE